MTDDDLRMIGDRYENNLRMVALGQSPYVPLHHVGDLLLEVARLKAETARLLDVGKSWRRHCHTLTGQLGEAQATEAGVWADNLVDAFERGFADGEIVRTMWQRRAEGFEAEIERLRAENAKLQEDQAGKPACIEASLLDDIARKN